MEFLAVLVFVGLILSFLSAAPVTPAVVYFRPVTIMGQTFQAPYSYVSSINKNVTTLLIAEKAKFNFVVNTAISILQHSDGAGAFALLCIDCKDGDGEKWGKKGIHVIGCKPLQEMSIYAFREDGPMPHSAVTDEGMRRHSVHMLYREWIKSNLLENGLSVFLVDIDISFTSSIPFFTAKEDVVLEAHWPNNYRKNWYSYQFGTDIWIILNNGVALFTPTPAMLTFGRQFMGMMVHSVVHDFGFAQTSFVKHLHELKLVLTEKSGQLTGATRTNLTVRAFPLSSCAIHPAGIPYWGNKIHQLKKHGAWWLPDDWEARWDTIESVLDYLIVTLPEDALYRFTDSNQVYINKGGILRGVPNLQTFMTFGKDFSEVKSVHAADRPRYTFGDMLPSA